MPPATATAATAAAATAITTVKIGRASALDSRVLGFGRSRTLRAPFLALDRTLRTTLAAPGGTLRSTLFALNGTLRTPLVAPGRTLRPLLAAPGGTLRSLLAAPGGTFRPLLAVPGGTFRPLLAVPDGTFRRLLAALALIAPLARPIALLPGPTARFALASSACSTLTIAAATPRSATAPVVGIRERRASGASHHSHPVGPRSDAEEPARPLFKDGDHHFGAGEAQCFQALRHRRVQRPAFENVALVGHLSPQSCASRPGGKTNSGMPALALQANLNWWGEPRPTGPWPAGVSSRSLAGALARCP